MAYRAAVTSTNESTVVTYFFFCQKPDYELKLWRDLKGLILQLVNQQTELKESLRSRWDTTNERSMRILPRGERSGIIFRDVTSMQVPGSYL